MGGTVLRLFIASTLLAACGSVKDSGARVDAADGPQDAGPDADETGMATIVTQAVLAGGTPGMPVGNIDIVSMLPNNTVLETTTTDASGNATIKVYPGGTVTAIYKHTADMGADLITYVDVKPNDTLTFGSRTFPFSGANPTIGSQTYSYPSQPGVAFYQVFTSCSSGFANAPTTSVSISEFPSCHKEPMDALYLAFTNTGSQNLISHYNFRTNVPFNNGANVAIGGWANAASGTVNVSGLPAEITSVSGQWTAILDGAQEVGVGNYSGQLTGGTLIANFPTAPSGERRLASLFLSRPNTESMRLVDVLTGTSVTQTIAAPKLPPYIQRGASGPFGGTSVLVSPALGKATWFLIGTEDSESDVELLRLNWSHTINMTSQPHTWHFIMSPSRSELEFPKLPAAFAEHVPGAADNVFNAQLRQIEISTVAGYDAARALPSADVMCIECVLRAGGLQRVIISGN